MSQDYLLSSVTNALRLLKAFSLEEPERKVTDLAAELGLGKSTVSRLLATLAREGFVVKDPETQKYRLGLSILELNTVATSILEINRESQPVLQRLVNETGESAHIALLEGMDVVYINKVDCKHPVQIQSHIGRRNPIHSTSSGKLLLSFQDEAMINQYIENGLHKYTAKTITDPNDFRAALTTIKEQGYAISVEELREGVATISAPIRDYTGNVIYALSLIGPVHRMNPYATKIIHAVKKAAEEISHKLGYSDKQWPKFQKT